MATRWNYFFCSGSRVPDNPEPGRTGVGRRDADTSSRAAQALNRKTGEWGPVSWLYTDVARSDGDIRYISTQEAAEFIERSVAVGAQAPLVEPLPPNPDPTAPDPDLRDPRRHDLSPWEGVPIDQQPRWQYIYSPVTSDDPPDLIPMLFKRYDPDGEPNNAEVLDGPDGRWYQAQRSHDALLGALSLGIEYADLTTPEAARLIQQAVDAGFLHPLVDAILPPEE